MTVCNQNHNRAEGIAAAMLFRSGYWNVSKTYYNYNSSRRPLIVGKHARKGTIKILVFAILSRSFSSRETALRRIVNGPLSLSPNAITEDTEVWLIDRKEHVYRFTRSDLQRV